MPSDAAHLAHLVSAGWAVTTEADGRGRNYWRARRGPWTRGAHRLASLRTLCDETPAGEEPRGTVEGIVTQLRLWRDAA